jgi:superfamily I DNA and/or RNA helicase/very-short-patch-repair endonuclease
MNQQFITYLGNKLKVGNLRTIHLNALPGRFATRLDITDFEILDGNSQEDLFQNKVYKNSSDFIFNNLLVKHSFQYKINFEKVQGKVSDDKKKLIATLQKRLNALVNQNEDDFLENGVKSFGFGYPLFIKRSKKDPSKLIKAPLLIWNLDISRSNNFKDQWIIERNEEAPVYINEILLSHIANDEGVKLEDVPWSFAEDGLIERIKLTEFVSWFLSRFGTKTFDVFPKIETCSDAKAIEAKAGANPFVLWSGIFGLYRTQKQSIIRDIDSLLEKLPVVDFPGVNGKDERTSWNASVRTDPSQHEIIHSLLKKEFKIIQGPPGTGKSQSLTAIITNALENGKKILVVCEKKTALDILYNNLKNLGLEKLVAMVDDVEKDRKKIIDTAREVAEKGHIDRINFNEREYDAQLHKFNELAGEFNKKHKYLLNEIFEGKSLLEILADFILFKRKFNPKVNLLDGMELSLQGEEYRELLNKIEKCADVYAGIESESLVFDGISPAIFIDDETKSRNIFEKIRKTREHLSAIDTNHIHVVDPFDVSCLFSGSDKQFSASTFSAGIVKIGEAFQAISVLERELVLLKETLVLSDFLNETGFSKKSGELVKLIEIVTGHRKTVENLKGFADSVFQCHENLNLPAKNNSLRRPFGIKVLRLFSANYKRLDAFWEGYRLNRTKYLAANENNLFTHVGQKIKKSIAETGLNENDRSELMNLLIEMEKHKAFFTDYAKWRTFFERQPGNIKSVISQLIAMGCRNGDDWYGYVKYFYYDKLLAKVLKEDDYNTNDRTLIKIAGLQAEKREQQRYKIANLWGTMQKRSIDEFNKRANINWLFNYRANTQYAKKNSLRKIVGEEFDLFTCIFPVVFVNPVVCSSILPLQPGIFDVVLFDEASQLRLEETYTALFRGKTKVISGDKHQMPPTSFFQADIVLETPVEESEENLEELSTGKSVYDKESPLFLAHSESLLEFGNNMNPNLVHVSYLDYHYRSRHPHLINFSNSAFYGNRLVPMPEKATYKPIRYFQVGGLYEEGNINTTEAKRIINYIADEYPVNGDGSFPSLGIATFNLQQRNLLKDLINAEAIQHPSFREKLEKIGEKEEWFVKNLENIQGDERDIIIISTTFGVNAQGGFRQNFGPVNTQKGYKLLNVIITRAKMNLLVFTSIPESAFVSTYEDQIEAGGNRGKAVFYAYLDYCKSIEEENEKHRLHILELVGKKCEERNSALTNSFNGSPFEAELYEYLLLHIPKHKLISHYRLGGYEIDFVILNESGKPVVAIECDGAKWHATDEAYIYDIHRQNILEGYGMRVYRIWAGNWWPDQQKEIKKLLKFISEVEASGLETERVN